MKLYQVSKKANKVGRESSEYKAISEKLCMRVLKHLRDNEEAYSGERLARVELDDGIRKQLEGLGYL